METLKKVAYDSNTGIIVLEPENIEVLASVYKLTDFDPTIGSELLALKALCATFVTDIRFIVYLTSNDTLYIEQADKVSAIKVVSELDPADETLVRSLITSCTNLINI